MLILLLVGAALTLMQTTATAPVDSGVSEALAAERRAAIHDLRYELQFVVPEQRKEPVRGRVSARFTLKAPHRIVLDFAQTTDRVTRVAINGRDTQVRVVNGHLVIAAGQTRTGSNEVDLEFLSGDEALNRDDEFLYTLFVPARAQLAFPCFDQPDLKARFTLSLDVPGSWQAVANGHEVESAGQGASPGRKHVSFAETQPLPTYLFEFVAGKFSVETGTRR